MDKKNSKKAEIQLFLTKKKKAFEQFFRQQNLSAIIDLQAIGIWEYSFDDQYICFCDKASEWIFQKPHTQCLELTDFYNHISTNQQEQFSILLRNILQNKNIFFEQTISVGQNQLKLKAVKNKERNSLYGSIECIEISNQHPISDFRFLMDQMPISIFIDRQSDETILEVNQTFLYKTGFFREEVLNQSIEELEFFSKQDIKIFKSYRKSLQSARDIDLSLISKSGFQRKGFISSQSIQFNGQKAFLNLYIDITEMKNMQIELEQHKTQLDKLIEHRTSKIDALNKELSALNEELMQINEQLNDSNIRLEKEIAKHQQTEHVLRQKEANLRNYFESDLTGIAIIQADGEWIEINSKLVEILGYNLDDLNKISWLDLLDVRYHKPNSIVYNKFLNNDFGGINQEIRIKDKNNNIRYIQLSVKEIGSDSSGKEQFVLHIQDITSSKLAEKAIRENEKKIRIILEKSPVGIFITDFEGIILYQNPAFKQLLKIPKTNNQPTNFTELINNPNKTKLVSDYQSAFYEELAQGKEISFLKANKEILYVFHSSIFLKEDEQNDQRVHFIIDLSERKKTETELTRYKEHLELLVKIRTNELKRREEKIRIINRKNQALLEALPYMYFVASKDGTFIDHKKGSGKLFFNSDDIIGKNINNPNFGLDKTNLALYQSAFERSLKTNKVEIFEYDYNLRNKEICVENHLVALNDDEYLCIIHDITKQKRYEQELIIAREKAIESDRLKTAFLANMSHEIRTPMNAILGFAQLLDDDELDSDSRKTYINYINKGTNELLSLLTDIVDVSKIESGKLKVENQLFQLSTLLNETYENVLAESSEKIKQAHIDFIYRHEESGIQLYLDPMRLEQVLKNLLNNAFKFTKQGEVELGFKYGDNKKVSIFVRDTGIGIPDEKKQIVFERFRQGDESFSKKYGGTGLGLSIAKSLVEQMGGEIWFESVVGEGTTFFTEFPITEYLKKNHF